MAWGLEECQGAKAGISLALPVQLQRYRICTLHIAGRLSGAQVSKMLSWRADHDAAQTGWNAGVGAKANWRAALHQSKPPGIFPKPDPAAAIAIN